MSYTNKSKNTAEYNNRLKRKRGGSTWDDMDMNWDDLEDMDDPTWDNLASYSYTNKSKNTASYTNKTKS